MCRPGAEVPLSPTRLVIAALLVAACPWAASCGSPESSPAPDVLLVLGVEDGAGAPALADLAAGGTRFGQAYAASPERDAHRAATLSGQVTAADDAGADPLAALRDAGFRASRFAPDGAEEAVAFLAGPGEAPRVAALELGADADAALARLLSALGGAGRADDTLVLALGDPAPGAALADRALRIPLVVRWPGRVPAGRVDDVALLWSLDVAPTLAALAGAAFDVAADRPGEDVRDALFGRPFERARPLVWRSDGDLAIRQRDFKLLLRPAERSAALYRVSDDPAETRDIARDLPGVAEHLVATVLAWRDRLRQASDQALTR